MLFEFLWSCNESWILCSVNLSVSQQCNYCTICSFYKSRPTILQWIATNYNNSVDKTREAYLTLSALYFTSYSTIYCNTNKESPINALWKKLLEIGQLPSDQVTECNEQQSLHAIIHLSLVGSVHIYKLALYKYMNTDCVDLALADTLTTVILLVLCTLKNFWRQQTNLAYLHVCQT